MLTINYEPDNQQIITCCLCKQALLSRFAEGKKLQIEFQLSNGKQVTREVLAFICNECKNKKEDLQG